MNRMRSFSCWLPVVLMRCAHVEPSENTIAEHRNEALIHQEKSAEERAAVGTSGSRRPAPRAPSLTMFGMPEAAIDSYNPTDRHLEQADLELKRANEHLAAAKELATFEAEACDGLSQAQRSACPLLPSSVGRVDTIHSGIRLTFRDATRGEETYHRLRCHLAYSEAHGFGETACPMFVKGVSLHRVGTDALEFRGNTDAVAQAIQNQSRKLLGGPP